MPCCFRHAASFARPLLVAALAEADAELLVLELLAHPATSVARATNTTAVCDARGVSFFIVMVLSDGAVTDRFRTTGSRPQFPLEPLEPPEPPEPPEPLEPLPLVAPEPALLAPESLAEVADTLPLLFLSPRTTTASPGRSECLETPRLLVILVADDSVTLTVLPEVSVM